MKKERIDQLLVDQGFADSLGRSRALVMSGVVLVNEQRVEKPAEKFSPAAAKIRLKGADAAAARYVSRGGLKLEKALSDFHIQVSEYVCLDVGASTGGFTDCLLRHGAKKVVAIDAGTNQLDWKLRNDARVETRENVNARFLKPEDFTEKFDLLVIDVSFISLKKIFPALTQLLKAGGRIVALIKPQFEVKKDEVEKGGIVTDPEKHRRVVEEIHAAAAQNKLNSLGTIESPITGAEGNREFLALYEKG